MKVYAVDVDKQGMKKWNFSKHIYENYTIPTTWYTPLIAGLDEIINCANCGKQVTYGDCYTSLTIHTNTGRGYPVCEKCHGKEWKERRLSRMNKLVEELIQRLKEPDYKYYGCELSRDEAELAISALKKQIPKKPREHYNWCNLSEDEKLETPRWYCESCDGEIKENYSYCHDCGQRLEW